MHSSTQFPEAELNCKRSLRDKVSLSHLLYAVESPEEEPCIIWNMCFRFPHIFACNNNNVLDVFSLEGGKKHVKRQGIIIVKSLKETFGVRCRVPHEAKVLCCTLLPGSLPETLAVGCQYGGIFLWRTERLDETDFP